MVFPLIAAALIGGGAVGPWTAGVIHDVTGSYDMAFKLCLGLCFLSAFAIWRAAPRKIRSVVNAP